MQFLKAYVSKNLISTTFFSFIVWLEPKCPKFLTKILKNRNYYNLGERL